jgi:hypothetical protein
VKLTNLSATLGRLDRKFVFFFDEYQSLFHHNDVQAAFYVASSLKRFMFNPGTNNLYFVVASSNSPVLWSCLSLEHPNGRDILEEMIVIQVREHTQEDLDATKAALVPLLDGLSPGDENFLLMVTREEGRERARKREEKKIGGSNKGTIEEGRKK